MDPRIRREIRNVLKMATPYLRSYPYVVGVGSGWKFTNDKKTNIPCITVSVIEKLSPEVLKLKELLPKEIYGIKIDVVQTGEFYAIPPLLKPLDTIRRRPAMPGSSIGHFDITAGTLGFLGQDTKGNIYVVSNNHVLANCNECQLNDPIYQPGPYDGGKENDTIAHLTGWVEIKFDSPGPIPPPTECPFGIKSAKAINKMGGLLRRNTYMMPVSNASENLVDAAIAYVGPANYIGTWNIISPEVRLIGEMTGIGNAVLDMQVCKSGRTSNYTEANVQQVDATVVVNYGKDSQGNERKATLTDQIITGALGQPGDSGSAILEKSTKRLVGLLFAGSDFTTIFCKVDNVLKLLDIAPVLSVPGTLRLRQAAKAVDWGLKYGDN